MEKATHTTKSGKQITIEIWDTGFTYYAKLEGESMENPFAEADDRRALGMKIINYLNNN